MRFGDAKPVCCSYGFKVGLCIGKFVAGPLDRRLKQLDISHACGTAMTGDLAVMNDHNCL
jgi:hypothetical protein